MTTSAHAAAQAPSPELGALVLAKAGAYRRHIVAALGELPDVTVLGALSTCEAIVDRARRNDVQFVLVDSDDIDVGGLARALAGLDRPVAWFALLEATESGASVVLQGAAGVIPRSAVGDTAGQAARIRSSLGTRLPSNRRTEIVALAPTPSGRASEAPLGSPSPSPSPMIGRIIAPTCGRREILAIGCSTGGPPAVGTLIASLPASFGLPICIVQHMSADHMPYFIENLGRRLSRPVLVAQHHLPLVPGHVYVAAGDQHMLLGRDEGAARGAGLHLRLSKAPAEHNCRPSVDPFFRSVAAVCGVAAVGVVLTGMGSDGALGALAMRETGAPVLVQNAETSVVWGMPGATYHLGAACAVLPLEELSPEILLWTLHSS